MTERHPDTGLHYTFAFPHAASSQAIREGYERLAARFHWMSVVDIDNAKGPLSDREALVIAWGMPHLTQEWVEHRAKTALMYFEPLGPFDRMLNDHVDYSALVWKSLRHFDAVFVHTPKMQSRMRSLVTTPAHLFPVGWDPSAGLPDFDAPKTNGFLHWGSMAGERPEMFDRYKNQLGDSLVHVNAVFGEGLRRELNASRAALYFPHSRVDSFSTWRIWQVLSSSALLVAPRGSDAWPLVADRHFWTYYIEDQDASVDILRKYLSRDLLSVARATYLEIADKFTMERCVLDYLVPTSKNLARPPE